MKHLLRSIWRLFLAVIAAVFGAVLGLIAIAVFASSVTLGTALVGMVVGAAALFLLTLAFPKPMETVLDIVGFALDP